MKKLLWISLLFCSVAFANFQVGDKLPSITLKDQFGKTMKIDANDKMLLLTFEKEVAIKTADLLKTKPKGYLKAQHIKYISDISKMPSFITSMFALPKMKKYPFSVMLIENDLGSSFAKKEEKITVYILEKQKIASIQFVTPKQLASMLQ
jgi:hypothetical protein